MSQGTLLDKVWDLHAVRALEDGRTQLFVGAHYMNEVTCSPAFSMLRERGLTVRFPQRTFGVVDHVNPTDGSGRPYKDAIAEEVTAYVEENSKRFGFAFYGPESADNGIVHVIMPELGITQPGMTICCGDSHTSTHGALGALATGLFAARSVNQAGADGLFYGHPAQFLIQLVAAVIVIGFAFTLTYGIATALNRTIGLSVSDTEEQVGLDISEHGERAYA